MKKILNILEVILLVCIMMGLSSCLGTTAASGKQKEEVVITEKQGPDLSLIRNCSYRGEIELQLGAPLKQEKLDHGKVKCIYKRPPSKKPSPSKTTHGALDFVTLGLWDAIGTPVKALSGSKEAKTITIIYDKSNKVIEVK